MQNNNKTNPDNNSNQTQNRRQSQAKKPAAKKPDNRTDEAGYQKLPHGLRPFGGCAQRDPLHYDSHPYPSMFRFAKHLALHFDAPRTRHSYYRQLRLIHEQCACDPSAIDEEMLRDYFLHVKNANFLVPQPALRSIFRARFRDGLAGLAKEHPLPAIDPAVWQKDWGVHLQPFGSGENIIKYLGRYVCRTAIGDSRLVSVSDTHVSFRWKDRANGDAQRIETIEGAEFVKRYLRHVLPRGLRAVRYYGFCHPAAKAKRERIAFHTGRPLLVGPLPAPPVKPPHIVACPCCGEPMKKLLRLLPAWRPSRAPPPIRRSCA